KTVEDYSNKLAPNLEELESQKAAALKDVEESTTHYRGSEITSAGDELKKVVGLRKELDRSLNRAIEAQKAISKSLKGEVRMIVAEAESAIRIRSKLRVAAAGLEEGASAEAVSGIGGPSGARKAVKIGATAILFFDLATHGSSDSEAHAVLMEPIHLPIRLVIAAGYWVRDAVREANDTISNLGKDLRSISGRRGP